MTPFLGAPRMVNGALLSPAAIPLPVISSLLEHAAARAAASTNAE